jgi:hypothetical protein
MTYSKTHQRFSERLKNPDALTNPEKYLGPNYQDVLNFWIYLDSLSDEEKGEMNDLYWALNYNMRYFANGAARNAAIEVVGWEFRYAAWLAADEVIGVKIRYGDLYTVYDVSPWRVVFCYATLELIGHHKLLEQDKTPTFLPLCVKP